MTAVINHVGQPIGNLYFDLTDAEREVGAVPVNFEYPSHEQSGTVIIDRYGTNTIPGTTSMQSAIDAATAVAIQAQCPVEALASTYVGAFSFRRVGNGVLNSGLIGAGSSHTRILQPPGTLTPGGVCEVNDTANGNFGPQISGFTIRGVTLDGNRANTTTPVSDITGHGCILTDCVDWYASDVRCVDCHNAGFIPVINSNYGHMDRVYVVDCGGAVTTPGFDINSSKHITGEVTSVGCEDGARVLDNCWGVELDITILDAVVNGFVYGNQVSPSLNESNNNILRVTVRGGCTSNGAVIAAKCRNSQLYLSVEDVDGHGVQEVYTAVAADQPGGNTYVVSTRKCGASSALIGGNGGNWTITSDEDGEAGGDPFAVIVEGQRNNITLNVTTPATPQIRGIEYTANSADNRLVAFNRNTLVSEISDAGSNNLAADYS